QFLDIFCTYFDPHSNYFALDAKANFMSALSTSNLSLGLELGMNEKDEIIVSEIIPAGPAAQSKQFDKDDVILKISDRDGREYIVSCTPTETIGDIIFSDANREIKITIRKKDGSQRDVALVKQVMKATENSVYSFIAEKKSRVGYIKIPSFYSDFDGESLQGVAQDVATEIAKLSKDGIDGLVLDLQDNGGGSMDEAVRLAGLFIDSGAVAVAVNNNGRQEILKDYDRGIYYGGPIVILVNGESASASEFFAGAMQDYRRALIIGATTLGKASVQTILPVDRKQQEFVKVTVQKFYRITGESGQIKGIVPDVHLPVIYDSIMPREKEFKNALKYDFIKTNVGRIRKYGDIKKNIVSKSQSRVNASRRFNDINAINHQVNRIYSAAMPPIALRLEDVYKTVDEISQLWKKVKALSERPTECRVSNSSFEASRISADALLSEINSDKMKEAQSNPYLEEAIDIITDWNAEEN
ncbi:MAG: peptidase S41, partial [Flavobacterium sp.]